MAGLPRGDLGGVSRRAVVRAGESLATSRAVREAKRDGQIGGMLLGLWSLFLDPSG